MIGYFLDAERNPEDISYIQYKEDIEWYVFRRVNEFIFACTQYMPECISIDNDLRDFVCDFEQTGYDAIKYFCNMNPSTETVVHCHTTDTLSKEKIEEYWKAYVRDKGAAFFLSGVNQ